MLVFQERGMTGGRGAGEFDETSEARPDRYDGDVRRRYVKVKYKLVLIYQYYWLDLPNYSSCHTKT